MNTNSLVDVDGNLLTTTIEQNYRSRVNRSIVVVTIVALNTVDYTFEGRKNIMLVLENLRFKSVGRLLLKKYKRGDYRHIKKRMHNGFVFCVGGEAIYRNDNTDYYVDNQHCLMIAKDTDYEFTVLKDGAFPVVDFELYEGNFKGVHIFEISEAESFYKEYLNMEKKIFSNSSHVLMDLSNLYNMTARINGYGKIDDRYKIMAASEKYMEKNAFEIDLDISAVAKQSNISEVYFRKLFKEKYGLSPYEHVTEKRIEKAKELLLYESISIGEIARKCGFNSIYAFSRTFKNIIGIAPNEFKKKYIVSK